MKQGPLVILVLVASSAPLAAEAPKAQSEAQVAAPSPSPSPSAAPWPAGRAPAQRREVMRREMERRQAERRQAGASAKAVVAARENNTQVQVVSVDTIAGTMTFTDVEGETNTWQFEPAAMAHDPLLKPGARVRIVWKSDEKTGQPIPTILGFAAFAPPSPAPASHGRRPRPGGRPGGPKGSPSPPPASPLPSPPPSPPPQ